MSISQIKIGSDTHEIIPNGLVYCTCDTAEGTAAKVATVVSGKFSLFTGARVVVKFTNKNAASSPTLNVAGTGAKAMRRYGSTAMSTGTTTTGWVAGAVQAFTYDGTAWVSDYWNNTTYSNASLGCGYGTCDTDAATAAKVVTLSSYALTTGGIVAVKFTYDVPASATLNINSKGAKAIYYRGAAITANVIKAGDVATFVYSTYYHLISIDRDNDTTYSAATQSANGLMSSTDKKKLDGIADGANAYSHPSTHAASMITGLATVATSGSYNDLKDKPTIPAAVTVDSSLSSTSTNPVQNKAVNTALAGKLATSLKGAANGLAELDANGKVLTSQLPSYVDDVIEATAKSAFPATGETGKIYVDTSNNKTYRWSGSAYVEISASLALGETSSTAYRGDRGKIAYDHSQASHARTDATKVEASSTNGYIKINGTETKVYTHPEGTNPHGTTKSDLGLGNVENKSSATIRGELTSSNVTNALGYTPPKQDTTYSAATQSAQGLMSASDKKKLDGIATGANNITVDSALSSTSTNPVQNKVINSALAEKAASSHSHSTIALGTLSSSSWSGSTYSFESTYPKATYDIEISLDSSATDDQMNAFSSALICGSYNSNVITAKGDVPTVDIPIIIKATKK